MLEIGSHSPARESEPLLAVFVFEIWGQVGFEELEKLVLVDIKVGIGDVEDIGDRHIVVNI